MRIDKIICKYMIIIFIFIIIILCQCENKSNDITVNTTTQLYREVGYTGLPNTNIILEIATNLTEPLDSDSIEISVVNDTNYYHPVRLCHRCLHFMGAFYKTKDSVLLLRAEKYTQKLLSISVTEDNSLYLPYKFNFNLHGKKELQQKAPWFSGMAQGEFLSVLVRLYEFTDDSLYLNAAHQVFNSLNDYNSNSSIKVSRIDSFNYYWIEEYPHNEHPGMTLNGYIAAFYGVYDYYRLMKDEPSKKLYDMCLTTLKHYIPFYRIKDANSYYCLGHQHLTTDGYHDLHIGMFLHLYRITGDEFFKAYAEIFENDH